MSEIGQKFLGLYLSPRLLLLLSIYEEYFLGGD